MTPPGPTASLGDNFPAKAYLLVAHLTATAPSVSSFAPDGTSFEIYDQGTLARDYLPRFFRHANYHSFVRQLNLYGFTSSRRKGNIEDHRSLLSAINVVVWHHEHFQRDRQDLVKEIKRIKKTKRVKEAPAPPPEVRIRTPSLSDDGGSASLPCPSAKPTDVDRGWLEAEFTKIAAQNKCLAAKIAEQNELLETRLECLLQLTLRIAPASASAFEDVAPGAKRCRLSPVGSHAPLHRPRATSHQQEWEFAPSNSPPVTAASHRRAPAQCQLRPVYEEQKVCDDDHCDITSPRDHYKMEPLDPAHEDEKACDDDGRGIAQAGDHHTIKPVPCQGDSASPPGPAVHKDQKMCDDDGRGIAMAFEHHAIELASYQGCGASPPPSGVTAIDRGCGTRDDTLTTFADITSNYEESDESVPKDVRAQDSSPDEESPRRREDSAARQGCSNDDMDLSDALLEEALNALAPGDVFAMDDGVAEPVASPLSHDPPDALITMANCAVDKTDGPRPIHSALSDMPLVPSGDIEAGHLPVGVTVVAAQAELVEEAGVDPEAEQHRRGERRDRRKVIYLLAFIGLVLSAGVASTVVFAAKKANSDKKRKSPPRPPLKPGVKPCQKLGGCPRGENGEDDRLHPDGKNTTGNLASGAEGREKEWRSWRGSSWKRRKDGKNGRVSLFDIVREEDAAREGHITSFSLSLGGKDFICNLTE